MKEQLYGLVDWTWFGHICPSSLNIYLSIGSTCPLVESGLVEIYGNLKAYGDQRAKERDTAVDSQSALETSLNKSIDRCFIIIERL